MKKLFFLIISALILLTSCDTKIADMLDIMERGNIICVDSSATAGGNGENWSNAFQTIEDAVDISHDGDEIWVAGSYTGVKAVSSISKEVTIVGGLSGDEEAKNDRDPNEYTEINNGDTVFTCSLKITFEQIDISNNTGLLDSLFQIIVNSEVYIDYCMFMDNNSSGVNGINFTMQNGSKLFLDSTEFKRMLFQIQEEY